MTEFRNGDVARCGFDASQSAVCLFQYGNHGSNVNAVEALTELLSLARQYETQVKLMKNVDENSQAAARLLQVS